MSFYSRHILPFLLDRFMRRTEFHAPRRRALAGARGRILELGFGMGANLPHYPAGVTRLEALEPNGRLAMQAVERASTWHGELILHQGNAEALPFGDESFDTVVTSFSLCSVGKPRTVLREVSRVLRPGGSYLFVEHGLSPHASIATWQRSLDPLQKRLVGGCRLTRDIAALLREAPFVGVESCSNYVDGLPKVAGYLTIGRAVAGGR